MTSAIPVFALAAALLACSAGVMTSDPAAESEPVPQAQAAAFDADRAWAHLKAVVNIGPRPAGSPGLEKTRAYIKEQMKALGLAVEEQRFQATTPIGPVDMVNLIARLPGNRPEKILFTGHYDTKPFKEFTFVGANDAGSSTAFLIELARVLKDRPREFTYELVWFDGEEAFCAGWYDCEKPGNPDNTYGSRHYVKAAQEAATIETLKAMVLVDMIAERNARFMRESQSTRWLTDIIWSTAARLGHGATFADPSMEIADDHVPFLQAGVPSTDIIDLDYGPGMTWWHTREDTIDKLSPRSMEIVGEVLLAALPEIEKRAAR